MGKLKELQISFQDKVGEFLKALERAKADAKLVDDYANLQLNPDYAHNVNAFLLGAFAWEATIEGKEFWTYVFKRVQELEHS